MFSVKHSYFWALTPAVLALPLVFSQTKHTIHLLSSFVVLPAYKKCRDYFWNKPMISPKMAIFALIHRTGRAHLFTNLYYYFFTFVQAFNSGFTAILNGAITLSSSVKAHFFLHFNTLREQIGYGSSFPQGIHHHFLQLYFFIDEQNLLFQVVMPLINLALITHLTMHDAAGLINFMVITGLFMVL